MQHVVKETLSWLVKFTRSLEWKEVWEVKGDALDAFMEVTS